MGFEEEILAKIEHSPTPEQVSAVTEMVRFMTGDDGEAMFLLTGFAGTGKTTLVAALVQSLAEINVKTILLAPTGRAAKVMAGYSDRQAFTIHKEIYRQKTFNGLDTQFDQDVNRHRGALFVVDEASMISGQAQADAMFGTGDLLEDLVQYVYSRPGCRLLLVGDTAQLPPVGCEQSPALSRDYLEGYGMRLFSAHLTEVVRQDAGGILWNATELRRLLDGRSFHPAIRFEGFTDIVSIRGGELLEALQDSYARCGLDDTIVVTRSNKRAGIYNNGIRA
ncbi:MAG: AAA family ATPase, partial [Bacteroidaceae bacterium]|nr:AAA family ATPase [Bacteroidaceae bacterium]